MSSFGRIPINITNLPLWMLRFIATNGEDSIERELREKLEDEIGQPIFNSDVTYFVFSSANEINNFYFPRFDPTSQRHIMFTGMINKIFASIFDNNFGVQLISARGNGLCAYSCLFMFLKTSRPDILDLFGTENFSVFRQTVRDMAVNNLNPEIRENVEELIDDVSCPELDPIFTAFVEFTGIAIITVKIDSNVNKYNISKFEHRDFPQDHIVIIRNSAHIMFLHTNFNFTDGYTKRQQIFQQIERNILR